MKKKWGRSFSFLETRILHHLYIRNGFRSITVAKSEIRGFGFFRNHGYRKKLSTPYIDHIRKKSTKNLWKTSWEPGTFQEPLEVFGGFWKVLKSSHFKNVKETKTSEVLREVLERFQVPERFFRGFWFVGFRSTFFVYVRCKIPWACLAGWSLMQRRMKQQCKNSFRSYSIRINQSLNQSINQSFFSSFES